MALGIVNFLIFDRFFNFFNNLENHSAIFENLSSIQTMGCEKTPKFSDNTSYGPGEVHILLFWQFFLENF